METRKQRPEQNDFEAFGQERAEPMCKRNGNLALYTRELLAKKRSLVHMADKNSQKIGS